MDEVRFWNIREVGKIQETARFMGKHIRVLMNEMDALKRQVDSKADAQQAVSEFDKLRNEVTQEFATLRQDVHHGMSKAMAEADITGTAAKLTTLSDLTHSFGAQVQEAFQPLCSGGGKLRAARVSGILRSRDSLAVA